MKYWRVKNFLTTRYNETTRVLEQRAFRRTARACLEIEPMRVIVEFKLEFKYLPDVWRVYITS